MGTQEHWTAAQYQEYLRQRAKGGNKYHAVKAQADGTWKQVVEDTKGAKTKEYIIKRKLMLYIHGISVKETDR